ncbi:arylacetamide deacetylase-like 4 [Sigmodon hispidus]
MAVLWLLLLVGLPGFFLGHIIWAVINHFLTAEIPSSFEHRVKFRIMHCLMLFAIDLAGRQGYTLEKLKICTMFQFFQFICDVWVAKNDPTLMVTNMHFGSIPVRLFQPKAVSSKLRRGIIFYHGGGAIIGSLDMYHGICSFLAQKTDSVLLSVGYRKLPGYHHPVIFKDCLNATIQFLKGLENYGVDPSRVVLCGESIGGWVVTIITQVLVNNPSLPRVRTQVLITPITQAINLRLPSHQQNKNVPFLTREIMITSLCQYLAIDLSWKDAMLTGAVIPLDKWKKYRKWLSYENIPRRFWSQDPQPEFLGCFNEAAYLETKHIFDRDISPLLADDKIIAQLPEVFLVTCEYDILRDDALLYKKRFEDQGVPVTWYHVEDGFHGCIALFDWKFLSFPCSMKILNSVVPLYLSFISKKPKVPEKFIEILELYRACPKLPKLQGKHMKHVTDADLFQNCGNRVSLFSSWIFIIKVNLFVLVSGVCSLLDISPLMNGIYPEVMKIEPQLEEHPFKFRFLHCVMLYLISMGNILEKLRICSMPRFIQIFHDSITIKKNHNLLVTNMYFGTIPVRLFQPKAVSSKLRRGIIFYHGGGAMCGSLDSYHNLCSFLAQETDSVVLSVGYRKLPDHHHPSVTKDCVNASIHFMKGLTTYKVDPSRVVACGESIGGGAVAIVTQALLSFPHFPKICAQVLITPATQIVNFQLPSYQQYQRMPFLTKDIIMTAVCKYMDIDLSWKDAIFNGTYIPPDTWKKYRKWLSSDNIPRKFKSKSFLPEFSGSFNEFAYLEAKQVLDAEISPLLVEDKIIAQLPQAFLVSCENDPLRDDALLYKKRLEDQGVPVTWYHVEDGFHGSIILFDKQPFSFPCSMKIVNAVISYIKSI